MQRVCHHLRYQRRAIDYSLQASSKGGRAARNLSTATAFSRRPMDQKTRPPRSHDRGPKSDEDTQTDFGAMDILGNMSTPATSIDACINDGFHLNNGIKTSGGSGIILVGGEAFSWRPWEVTSTRTPAAMLSKVGTLDIGGSGGAWGMLELLWPKPDLLIFGTGGKIWPLSKATREHINGLGMRIDVMDTGNASAAYNLLATERGTDSVAAVMLPLGWRGR